jgi:BirA family biotin operon repressor/biotin-[acetyl-CoA-carboxylase] ligase
MGRSWHSPSGLGLFVSVLFRPRRAAAEATRWTLGAAVAGTQACRQLAGVQVEIEWPNDLVWEGRKLGGVLAEARSTAGGPTDLVVGTGVNVGHGAADLPDELATTATSLRLATGGHVPERETLAVRYVRLLAGIAGQLNRGEWNAVRRRWEELAPTASGHPVRVLSQGGRDDPYDGVTAGIDATGALRVRRSAGEVSTVHASDSVVWREV